MSAIRNIPIGRKFKWAFGIVCLLCTTLGVYSCLTYLHISKKALAMERDFLPSIIHLSEMRGAFNLLRRQDLDLAMCTSRECLDRHATLRRGAIESFEGKLKLYEPLVDQGEERTSLNAAISTYSRYRELSDRGAVLAAAGKKPEALAVSCSAV